MSARTQTVSKYVVEPVEQGDIRSVMRLAWKTTPILYPAVFFEEIAERQPEYFRVVREAETNRVVAFVIAAKQPGLKENILLLAIEPDLVGLGLRRALMEEVQRLLKAEGVRHFAVQVPSAEPKLLDFFRNEGFEVLGLEGPGVGSDFSAYLAKAL